VPATPKMTWEKSSPELVQLFEEISPRDPDVEHKKMFAWPCVFLNGNLFAGLHKENIIYRLPELDQERFLKLEGAGLFSPMPGRPMKGFVILSDPLNRSRAELSKWMSHAFEYATTLPPKEKKSAKKGTAKKVPRKVGSGRK
jgi:hypothetical protein